MGIIAIILWLGFAWCMGINLYYSRIVWPREFNYVLPVREWPPLVLILTFLMFVGAVTTTILSILQ